MNVTIVMELSNKVPKYMLNLNPVSLMCEFVELKERFAIIEIT